MMGLPESGKTTYLAALYHTLRAEEGIRTGMALRVQPKEREYFHEIETVWLSFAPMPRSRHSEPKDARLELTDTDAQEIDLSIPDVSGETFDALWERGSWLESVRSLAISAHGLLLFARADDVDFPELINVVTDNQDGKVLEAQAEAEKWHPEQAPTQTKLADLLESIWEVSPQLPVAIAASAWDAVAANGASPQRWLEINLPLLWQMLESNSESHPWRVFGISAQGGDVTDLDVRQKLALCKPPGSRVLVQDGEASHDLTIPLTWLLKTTH